MDKIFFGKPFKSLILALIIGSVGLIGFGTQNSTAQGWEDARLKMDLQAGGAELFKDVSSSIIQVYNLDYETLRSGGGGSGYVIDNQGHAITNHHVTTSSQVVEIAFFGDEDTEVRHKGIVIGADPQLDLAVLKIVTDPANIHPIKLGDSEKVRVGDVVATLGSPGGDAGIIDLGDRSRATANWLDFFNFNLGVVDEILEFQHAWRFYNMGGGARHYMREQMGQYYGSGVQYLFHVSAAINSGNSGGPCINAYGEAIGTNTWGSGGENVGYSVPTNFLKRSTQEIIQYGRPITPWCGILLHPPDMPYKWGHIDAPLGLSNQHQLWFDIEPERLEVYHVNSYSPAEKAGIKKGDILLSVDNIKFTNIFDIYSYFLNGRIGQEVTLMIERNGMGLPPITVKLEEKKIRFDTIKIDTFSMRGYSKPYQVTLTY